MNAPIRFMLTEHEATSHLAIIEVLSLLAADEIGHGFGLHLLWEPLTSFAPRCNCGQVLKFGPWRDGRRLVACRCGVSYSEHKIRHGIDEDGER